MSAALVNAKCRDGAIGSAVGEMMAQIFKPANGMFYSEQEKANVLAASKIVAGAVTAYVGGDVQTALITTDVAVKNNALFAVPLIYMLAGAATAYTTGVGEGNPLEGLKNIGQGNDPLSKAMANATQAAVELSMSQFPRETTATLNFLAAANQTVEATLTYLDDKTGRLVSTQWNSLSPDVRSQLVGLGKVTSVTLTPVGVGQVKNLAINAPKNITEQTRVLAQQAMIKEAGVIDPLTGKPALNLSELAKQPGGLSVLKEATGDLFGNATMQTLFRDAQYIGGTTATGQKGLDAVFKVNSKDVDYLFVEYKYNTSKQGMTADGLQGSMDWITGSDRITKAVGDKLAPSIRTSAEKGRTETLLIQTLPDGRSNVKLLGSDGKPVPLTQSKLDLVQRITNNLNKGILP